ncbi:MAG: ankyrin repeat domain-containing protein [Candidatus Micrarchaeota archaeon]
MEKARELRDRSPFLVGVRLMEPEGLRSAGKADLFLDLEGMAKARDAAGVRNACSALLEIASAAGFRELDEMDQKMQVLLVSGKRSWNSGVLDVLSEAAGKMHAAFRNKALEADKPPEMRGAEATPNTAAAKSQKPDEMLLEACAAGNAEAVRRALAQGADPRAKDARGRTAMDLAHEDEPYFDMWVPKNREAVEALREAMMKKPEDNQLMVA